MSKILLLSLAALIFLISPLVWSYPEGGILILDARNVPELPKRFRLSDPKPNAQINWQGFANLNMIGSAQFSKAGFERVLQRLKVDHLMVVDLRQESHGFLNGNAISWFSPHNAINANKKDAQIEKAEHSALQKLTAKESAKVQLVLKKENGRIVKAKNIEFSIHNIAAEEEYIHQQKSSYVRFYVQDFHAPNDAQVDRFIKMVTGLPANQWVYFHCRGGSGRTSTFMAIYDMMKTAKQVSFEDILARQVAIGGKDLAKMPDKHDYKYKSAQARLAFLKKFYEYARTNADNFQTPFQQWKHKNANATAGS